ncbi:hypothetical protein BDB00DRAFT_828631 [Zychaea mexicana]|uniref:uncharacterized protein n=1 Tax=Zychaea mexicana TaxID=64656 RepID=UPI0022FEEED8|nr:uncharacterized protein BDB00DRAFT_828631 [Zychaea mexicana]KAI9492349.1 hypothetical protein BDB00DRAFT_828631 [Zychaea mexicana]
MTEKVFIVGGTGHIGERCVQQLLNNNVHVTLYTRSPAKVQAKFPQAAIVEGDYNDLTPLEKGIAGHTRLFLLIADLVNMPHIKGAISAKACATGVKQIVDLSSLAVTLPWRSTFLGNTHRLSEEAILASRSSAVATADSITTGYVALRPTMFMTNHLWIDAQTIKNEGVLRHTADPDELEGWISNNDIGDLAAIVLQEPIEKHGDAVYEMTGCVLTPAQRIAALGKVAGREIGYTKISTKEKYDFLTTKMGMPHIMAMDLLGLFKGVNTVSVGLSVLLGREPESFEQWLEHNKDVFQ